MTSQQEWRCVCGYALLAQPHHDRVLMFDGYVQVFACPRCTRDLRSLQAPAVRAGQAIALLDRARAGEPLDTAERAALAGALGITVAVLEELLAERQLARSRPET